MSRLHLRLTSDTESAAEKIRAALQISLSIRHYEQSPREQEELRTRVEANLYAALNLLNDPAPPAGIPGWNGRTSQADGDDTPLGAA